MRSHLRRRFGALEEVEPPPHIHRAIDAVASVMNGEKVDLSDLVLDVRDVPEFNRRVRARHSAGIDSHLTWMRMYRRRSRRLSGGILERQFSGFSSSCRPCKTAEPTTPATPTTITNNWSKAKSGVGSVMVLIQI
jgi:hypothetical protein